MNRTKKYFKRQKENQEVWSRFSKLRLTLATQADFPDSGYYYAKKERELNRIHDNLVKIFRKDVLKRKFAALEQEANRQEYNYYDKVQDCGYTAAEMDQMMAQG
jgi:hypothetical protein